MARAAPVTNDAAARRPDGWTVLGWIGAAIVVAGLSQFVPVWLPPRVHDQEWVIASAEYTSGAFPALAIGLGFVFAAASAHARWKPLVALGIAFGVLAIIVLGSGLVYGATKVALMQDLSAGDPALLRGARWTAVRTGWSHLLAGGFALVAGVVALQQARLYRMRQRL